METQEQVSKIAKKQVQIDWRGLAIQFGTTALQGLVGGVATAVGASMTSRVLNPRVARSPVAGGENVFRLTKTGTA